MKPKITKLFNFENSTKPTDLDSYAKSVVFNLNLKRVDNGDPLYKDVVFQSTLQAEDNCPTGVNTFYEECKPFMDFSSYTNITVPTKPKGEIRNNFSVPYFNGIDAYLLANETYSDPHLFPYNTDYCWEMWINLDGLPSLNSHYPLISKWDDSYDQSAFLICIENVSNVYYITFKYKPYYSTSTPTVIRWEWPGIDTGNWHHLAVNINNIYTIRSFIDGVQLGSPQTLIDYIKRSLSTTAWSKNIVFGSQYNNSGFSSTSFYKGYMSDIRITKASRYTSNFEPPTSLPKSSLIYTDDISNGVVSKQHQNDLNAYRNYNGIGPFGNETMYFAGAYGLCYPYNYMYNIFLGNPFTIECWVKITFDTFNNSTKSQILWSFGVSGGLVANSASLSLVNNQDENMFSYIKFIMSDSNNDRYVIYFPFVGYRKNDWNHVALCRDTTRGEIKLFWNGTLLKPFSKNLANQILTLATNQNCIGTDRVTSNGDLTGEVSEFRITNRICRYNEIFDPPTSSFDSGDPYWNFSTFLFHFDDTNPVDSYLLYRYSDPKFHTLNNASSTTLSSIETPTGYGTTPTGKNRCTKFSNASVTFTQLGSELNFGSGDFTIEFYIYLLTSPVVTSGTANQNILNDHSSDSDSGFKIYLNSTDYLCFHTSNANIVTSASPIIKGTWYHIAVERKTGVVTLYINGAVSAFANYSSSIGYAAALTFGSTNCNFYLEEFRITKGITRYGGVYTPPTTALPDNPSTDANFSNLSVLYHFNTENYNYINSSTQGPKIRLNPRGIVDLSTNVKKFGNSCVRFYGSGFLYKSYLREFGVTNNFTIEGWINPQSVTGTQIVVAFLDTGSTYPSWEVKLNGTSIQFSSYSANDSGNAIINSVSFGTVAIGNWYHFAISRYGSTWKGYLNGVETVLGTSALNPWQSTGTNYGLSLGADSIGTTSTAYNGYIDEFRITRDFARYTSDFSGSIPSIAFSNTGIGDLYQNNYGLRMRFDGPAVNNDDFGHVITSSSAVLSTTQSKFGGQSLYLNGSAYLSTPSSTDFSFTTNDFTIEFWLFVSGSFSAQNTIFDNRSIASDSGFQIYTDTNAYINLFSSNAAVITGSTPLSLNTWYHIAIVRVSGTVSLYVNGTSDATPVSYSSSITCPGTLYIGRNYNNALLLTGYIDDIRINNGIARYYANFTAPTQEVGVTMEGDPLHSLTTIANRGNGVDGSNWNAVQDQSYMNLWNYGNITYSGAITTSETQYKFLGSSIYGNNGFIFWDEPQSSSESKISDFTFEGWFYPTTSGTATVFASIGSETYYFYKNSSNKIVCALYKNSARTTYMTVTGNTSLSTNTWYHIAITKRGIKIRIFLNGVLDNSGDGILSDIPMPVQATKITLLAAGNGTTPFYGYAQDIRFTKYCKYISNFIPPQTFYTNNSYVTPLLLHFEGANESTTFIDERNHLLTASSANISTSQYKFGSASGYFSGGSSVVTIGNILSDFAFLNHDFNIEFWVYVSSVLSDVSYIYYQDHNPYYIWARFDTVANGSKLQICVGDPARDIYTSSLTASSFTSAFRHVMISKRDRIVKLFVDGVLDGNQDINYTERLGKDYVKLLLHCEGSDNGTTFIDNSYTPKTITVAGASKTKTIQKQFGNTSGYFDGTSNTYLTTSVSTDNNLGTGDFTIECWVYPTTTSAGARAIVHLGTNTAGLYQKADKIEWYDATDTDQCISSSITANNKFYHVVVVRSSSVISLYVDGVKSSTTYTSARNFTAGQYWIGANQAAGELFIGYIDEVRILAGYAAYSEASFTPPTVAFYNQDVDLFQTPNSVKIGGNGTNGFNGYLDELRVTHGSFPYKERTNIPTEAFPTIQSDIFNEITDTPNFRNYGCYLADPPVAKFGKALYFDGTANSWISSKQNLWDWQLDKDFTVEFWFYNMSTSGTFMIMACAHSSYYYNYGLNVYGSSGILYVASSYTGAINLGSYPTNTWTHIAICRKNINLYIFLNGVKKSTQSITAGSVICGITYYNYFQFSHASFPWKGYLDGVMFIKGYAKYISPFSVPTQPPSIINLNLYRLFLEQDYFSNLLAHYNMDDSNVSSQIIDATGKYNLTTENTSDITPLQTALVPMEDNSYAIKFSGGDGYNSSISFAGRNSFSIYFYIKTDQATNIIYKEGSINAEVLSNGKISFTITSSDGDINIISNSTVDDDLPHFVILEWLSGNLTISIDGEIDNIVSTSILEVTYKYTEDYFGIRDTEQNTDVLLQLRCNTLSNDFPGKDVLTYGTPVIYPNSSVFGGSCLYLDGSSHLEIPKLNFSKARRVGSYSSSKNGLGCPDLTVECWVYIITSPASYCPLVSSGTTFSTSAARGGGISFGIETSRKASIKAGTGSSSNYNFAYLKQTTATLNTNQWYHLAFVIKDDLAYIYIDGTNQSLEFLDSNWRMNTLYNLNIFSIDNLNIGASRYHQGGLTTSENTGYRANDIMIDDIRITERAIYTSSFTRPVTELTAITSPGMESTNDFAIQNFDCSLVYGPPCINQKTLKFNGSTDYLQFYDSILEGTFTIDFWIFWLASVSTTQQVFLSQTSGSDSANTSFGVNNGLLYIDNGSNGSYSGSTQILPHFWYHIAVVRSGTTCKLYLNGTLEITHSSFQEPVRVGTQFGSKNALLNIYALVDALRVRTEQSWTNDFSVPVQSDYIADTYYDNVSLLLRDDLPTSSSDPYVSDIVFQARLRGENNSKVFLEDTVYPALIQNSSNSNVKIVTSHFKHNNPSIYFDGVDNALVLTNNTGIRFGTTWTLEFWLYANNFTTRKVLFDKRESSNNTGIYCYIDTDSKLYFNAGDSSDGFDVTLTSGVLTATTWTHVAIVRNASDTNSWKLFVGGTQSGSTVNSAITIADNTDLIIGRSRSNTLYFNGYLSEIQLTSSAKYTTNFTAPTSAALTPPAIENDYTSLLLHCEGTSGTNNITDSSWYSNPIQVPRHITHSSTQYKIGTTSLFFDTPSYCITIPYREHLNILDGDDFTIEFWMYGTGLNVNRTLISMYSSSTFHRYGPLWWLSHSSSAKIIFYLYGLLMITSSASISASTWTHIALTRRGDVLSLYIAGALDSSIIIDAGFKFGPPVRESCYKDVYLCVGGMYDNTDPNPYAGVGSSYSCFTGYLDEIRVVKGKAMYTTPFTPSTSAFSVSSNYPVRDSTVKLFLDVDDYTIKEKSSNLSKLTLEGGIIAENIIGGSSAFFDHGTHSSGLALRQTVGDAAFEDKDFTIEAWVNPTTGGHGGANSKIIESQVVGTWGGWNLVCNASDNPAKILFHDSLGGSWSIPSFISSATIANSTWTHITITRKSGYLTMYFNGVPQVGGYNDNAWDSRTGRAYSSYAANTLGKSAITTAMSGWNTIFTFNPFDVTSSTGVYVEFLTSTYAAKWAIGVANAYNFAGIGSYQPGYYSDSWGFDGVNVKKGNANSWTSYGSAPTNNCILMMAIRNGKIWWGKDGTWFASGDPANDLNAAYTNLTGTLWVAASCNSPSANTTLVLRTHSGEFSYAIPKGFVGLRDKSVTNFFKSTISIGSNNSNLESFNGYISDVRLTKYTARYEMAWSELTTSGDTYAANVALLLNCNGTQGSTVFTDSSNTPKSITANGTTIISTANKRFGTASGYFDGTGGYLETADQDDWNFGTGDFTIEMWYQFEVPPTGAYNAAGSQVLCIQQADNNNYVGLFAAKTGLTFEVKSGGSTLLTLTGTLSAGSHDSTKWHHIAITRATNTFTMWYDGASLVTSVNSITLPDLAATLVFGYLPGSTRYFWGWLDDIRITKGVCRYPSGFGYAGAPRSLQPISNVFSKDKYNPHAGYNVMRNKDVKKFNSSFYTGGIYGPDTTTNPSITGTRYFEYHKICSAFVYLYNDFTIEGWFYPLSSATGHRYWMATRYNISGDISLGVSKDTISFSVDGITGARRFSASVDITTWAHIAWVRQGTSRRIYLNGVQVAEETTTYASIDSYYYCPTEIGSPGSNCSVTSDSLRYYGYIDGVRITRGICRYTSDFSGSLSSSQFPRKYNIFDNTRFMLHFNEKTFPMPYVYKMGNPQINIAPSELSEAETKGCLYFNGNTSYVILHDGNSIITEDFTVEFWANPLSWAGAPNISTGYPRYLWAIAGSLADAQRIGIVNMSNMLYLQLGSSSYSLDVFPLNTWSHIAVTRESGTVRVFFNGVKKYEGTFTTVSGTSATLGLIAEDWSISAATDRFHGFIKNFRTLKNVVSYKTDFTPSHVLSYQNSDSYPSILDPGNPLYIAQNGNCILDNVGIMLGSTSNLMNTIADYHNIYYQGQSEYMGYDADISYKIVPNSIIGKFSDSWHFGTGKIYGTITDSNGNKLKRKVYLLEYGSAANIDETLSDETTGYYEFTELDTDSYFTVIAEDVYNFTYNDIIRSKVRAE